MHTFTHTIFRACLGFFVSEKPACLPLIAFDNNFVKPPLAASTPRSHQQLLLISCYR